MTAVPAPMVPCGRLGFMITGAPPSQVIAIGDALEAELVAAGWTRVAESPTEVGIDPGVRMVRGQWKFDLRRRLADVAMRLISPEQWQEACNVAGIGGVQIELPSHSPPGEPAAKASGLSRPVPRWLWIPLVALALAGIFWLVYVRERPAAITPQAPKANYIIADGKSNLAGGYVTTSYELSGQDWERTQAPTNQDGENDGAQWWLGQLLPSTKFHFGMDHRIWIPAIDSKQKERDFAAWVEGQVSNRSGGTFEPSKTSIDGRRGYAWEYTTAEGKWSYDVWVLGPVHSFYFGCDSDSPNAADLKESKSRCKSLLSRAKFHISD